MPARPCVVSFTDPDGFLHAVEVQAESLYEAVVLAAKAFQVHGCLPGVASALTVRVKSPDVTHEVTLGRVRDWLNGTCNSPSEKLTKARLKAVLER